MARLGAGVLDRFRLAATAPHADEGADTKLWRGGRRGHISEKSRDEKQRKTHLDRVEGEKPHHIPHPDNSDPATAVCSESNIVSISARNGVAGSGDVRSALDVREAPILRRQGSRTRSRQSCKRRSHNTRKQVYSDMCFRQSRAHLQSPFGRRRKSCRSTNRYACRRNTSSARAPRHTHQEDTHYKMKPVLMSSQAAATTNSTSFEPGRGRLSTVPETGTDDFNGT